MPNARLTHGIPHGVPGFGRWGRYDSHCDSHSDSHCDSHSNAQRFALKTPLIRTVIRTKKRVDSHSDLHSDFSIISFNSISWKESGTMVAEVLRTLAVVSLFREPSERQPFVSALLSQAEPLAGPSWARQG